MGTTGCSFWAPRTNLETRPSIMSRARFSYVKSSSLLSYSYRQLMAFRTLSSPATLATRNAGVLWHPMCCGRSVIEVSLHRCSRRRWHRYACYHPLLCYRPARSDIGIRARGTSLARSQRKSRTSSSRAATPGLQYSTSTPSCVLFVRRGAAVAVPPWNYDFNVTRNR
jgi:hypothetical protein